MMNRLLILLLVLLQVACGGKKAMTVEEYKHFMSSGKSGMITSREFNGVNYKLKMQPPAYLALVNSETGVNNEKDFKQELDYYKDKMNFVLLIEDAEHNDHRVKSTVFDKAKYTAILEYANTELRNDLMLVSEKDTVYCQLAHLEAANSVQPLLRISISFNQVNPAAKEFTLIYNDQIFNNGPVKFHYAASVVEDLPALKF